MSCCDLDTTANLRRLATGQSALTAAQNVRSSASRREAPLGSRHPQEPAAIVVVAPVVGAFIWATLIFLL